MNGLVRAAVVAVAVAVLSGTFAVHADTTVFGTYGYDGAGNITAIGIDFYYYDAFGRLKYGTVAHGMFSARYDYDRYGNMTAPAALRAGAGRRTTSIATARCWRRR